MTLSQSNGLLAAVALDLPTSSRLTAAAGKSRIFSNVNRL